MKTYIENLQDKNFTYSVDDELTTFSIIENKDPNYNLFTINEMLFLAFNYPIITFIDICGTIITKDILEKSIGIKDIH